MSPSSKPNNNNNCLRGSRRDNKCNSTITVIITKIFAYSLQRKNYYSGSRSLTTGLSTSVLSFISEKHKNIHFQLAHGLKYFGGGGKWAKSVLSYGALASHTRRSQSSFNRFIQSFYKINSVTHQPRNNH